MASLDAAKTCAHVAGLDMTSYALFATALWTGHVDAYVSETATPGVSQTLTEGNPPAPGGTLLGWDVLGTEYGGLLDHSWLCGSIQDAVAEDLGIVPNDLGLLNTLAEAAAVVRWIDDGDGMRGEPASWFPWQVLRYQSL